MYNLMYITIIILLVLGGVFYFLSQKKGFDQKSPVSVKKEEKMEPAKSSTQQTPNLNKPREIIVKVADFNFDPAEISVKKGEKISIILQNIGISKHNFTVDEFSAQTKTIKGGGQDFVVFTPDKSGEFH